MICKESKLFGEEKILFLVGRYKLCTCCGMHWTGGMVEILGTVACEGDN